MKIETQTAGMVEVLDSCWYQVRNYQNYLGKDFPVCAVIGIVKYRDSWGIVKTRIGVADGLHEEQDLITIIDAGVKFYNTLEAQNDM